IEPAPQQVADPPVAVEESTEMGGHQSFQLSSTRVDIRDQPRGILGTNANDVDLVGFTDIGAKAHRELYAIELVEPLVKPGADATGIALLPWRGKDTNRPGVCSIECSDEYLTKLRIEGRKRGLQSGIP